VASSLNGDGQLTLMQSAGTGDSSGKNLGTLGNELAELCSVLVVDLSYFFSAECANFFLSLGSECLLFFIHDKFPPYF